MIEGKFEYAIGAKPVGFSHGDFGLVIQALHNAARDQLLSPEVVEDELAVLTQRACDLLHRLDAGPHGLAASNPTSSCVAVTNRSPMDSSARSRCSVTCRCRPSFQPSTRRAFTPSRSRSEG